MLTKNDLQQIRVLVKEEVHTAIREETPRIVRPIIQEELKPVKKKLDKLHKDFHSFVDHFDKRLTKVEVDVKTLKQQVTL